MIYQCTLPLGGNGGLLWVNLGENPEFAQSLIDGDQLTLRTGNHVMVYPLADAELAMLALYECLEVSRQRRVARERSVFLASTFPVPRAPISQKPPCARSSKGGFGDSRLRDQSQTAEQYGSCVFLSGPAWGGEAEFFASVFGVQGDSKKALTEAVNDAARLCRDEVQARLVHMDEPIGIGQFGRSSLLCSGESSEFVLESFERLMTRMPAAS